MKDFLPGALFVQCDVGDIDIEIFVVFKIGPSVLVVTNTTYHGNPTA